MHHVGILNLVFYYFSPLYFLLVICSLTSVILVGTKVNYDADFHQVNTKYYLKWILNNDSVTAIGKGILEPLFETIRQTDALRSECSKGKPFMFLWVSLILVVVDFLASLYAIYAAINAPSPTMIAERKRVKLEAKQQRREKRQQKRDLKMSRRGGDVDVEDVEESRGGRTATSDTAECLSLIHI